MKIIEQSHEILHITPDLLENIEAAARTCYQSEQRITTGSSVELVAMLIRRGHFAMIEFGTITVSFITNRGVTHELVRHRLCTFAQESQRYVQYRDIEFIRPEWWHDMTMEQRICWESMMGLAERTYQSLTRCGSRPEQARDVLPNAVKTKIVVMANVREWRHILTLRTSRHAHPQMRALMLPLLAELTEKYPVLFGDIKGEAE